MWKNTSKKDVENQEANVFIKNLDKEITQEMLS
jgi:hypothetical protein